MSYRHQAISGEVLDLPLGKIVCVGRNYADHIAELNNSVPAEPLLFIKPNTALAHLDKPLQIPKSGPCHNELELALLVKKPMPSSQTSYSDEAILEGIWGIGLGLDLTLREKQTELKSQGYPWERAKAFDASCPLSAFIPLTESIDLQALAFQLNVNGEIRQRGDSSHMMHTCVSLVREILSCFTLLPGDVVMTGTPKGVGPLQSKDVLSLSLRQEQGELLNIETQVK